MNVRNRVSICTLIIGLIYPSTQLARGQQSDPVQPPAIWDKSPKGPKVPLHCARSWLRTLA